MQLTEAISSWIFNTSYDQLPPHAIEAANMSCFDCLGVALAGSVQPLGKMMTDYVGHCGGNSHSTVVGTSIRTSASMAALANATYAHAIDFDNAGGFGHPAAVLFPALLALAEARNQSGRDLLEAYVIGCEVGLALYYNGGGASTAFPQMKRGFHSTPVFGRLAAAAACAKLMKLDERKISMAIGIATSSASGMVGNLGTMTKALHAGCAARDGVIACELASSGWTAGKAMVEQQFGFMKSFFGDMAVNADQIAARLGRIFMSPLVFSIKKYPTCGHNSPVMESISGIMRDGHYTAADITEIEINVSNPLSEVLLYSVPTTALEAKFSIRYNAAIAAMGKEQVLFSKSDEEACDPEILNFMEKIKIRVETRDSPQKGAAGAVPVRLRFKNGDSVERATPPSAVEGASTKPMALERICEKFLANAELVFAADQAKRLLDQWLDLKNIGDVSAAVKLAAR